MRPLQWAPLLFAALSLAPSPARAHGGRPQTQAVLVASDGSGRVVSIATFGLLTREREGAPWEWTCQESIPDAVAGIAQPAVLAGDLLLIAGNFGLVRGAGTGCGWEREDATRDRFVPDVVTAPDGRVITLTGDSGVENRLYESRDGGRSFAAIGAPLRAGFLPERVRIAPSDPSRIYVVGQAHVAESARVRGVVLRSDDGGASWRELDLGELANDERVLRGLAVHPERPDVLYAVAQGNEHDRLLRTEDGGATWTEVLYMGALPIAHARPFALAIVPGTGAVWFGNTAEGLYSLSADGTLAHEDKYVALACLTLDGRAMWMCADGLDDGFAIARFSLDVPYEPVAVARFGEVARRTCGTDVDCECDAWWDDFLVEVERAPEVDGSGPSCEPLPDGGTLDAGAAPAPRGSGGCAVSAPSAGRGRFVIFACAIGGLALSGSRLRRARRAC